MVADYGLLFREIEFAVGSAVSFCLAAWLTARAVANLRMRRTEMAATQMSLAVPHWGNWIFFSWVWLISISRIAGFRAEWDPRTYFFAGYIGIGVTALGVLWAIYMLSPRKWAGRITLALVVGLVAAIGGVHLAAWIYTGGHLNLTPPRS